MAGKDKVDIKRSDQFQEVDAELSRAMDELDFTIERVSAIFDGRTDEFSTSAELSEGEGAAEDATPAKVVTLPQSVPESTEAEDGGVESKTD